MARITTKTGLIDYIKQQLGYPTIKIEVTDAQIGQIIDDSVQKFTEYAYGTLEDSVIIQLNGPGEYAMPDTITNIIKLSKGGAANQLNFNLNFGAGQVPNIWSEQFFSGAGSIVGNIIPMIVSISTNKSILEKYFGDDLYYNFNYMKKTLQVLENYSGAAVLHYQYEYLADEAGDYVYNHEWIKGYTVSKTKMLWGTVTGKYDQALVGGARINYGDMKSEAQQELEFWNEQLLTKWSDPAPVSVA